MTKLTIRVALAAGIAALALAGFGGAASAAPAQPGGGPACIGCW